MPTTVNLDKNQVLFALEIAANQQKRAASKFNKGTAAYEELSRNEAAYTKAALDLKNEPTALEAAIDKTKK